jgi:hypothetical protein
MPSASVHAAVLLLLVLRAQVSLCASSLRFNAWVLELLTKYMRDFFDSFSSFLIITT